MSEADTMDFTSTGEVVVNPERMHKGGTHAGSNWISRVQLQNGYYYYYYIRLTAFFQDNLGKPAPEG